MKPLHLFIAGCLLAACSKSDDSPETIKEPAAIYLWPGEDSLYTVEGNTQPLRKASSSNEQVVKATIKGNGMQLVAGIPGQATVQFTNAANKDSIRKVITMDLGYSWQSLNNPPYSSGLTVEAADAAVAAALKAELSEKIKLPARIMFRPTDSVYRMLAGTGGAPVEGTFSFGALTLTLKKTGAADEVYKVIPYSKRTVLGLVQDLTGKYQALYPDKGIKKIIWTWHISQLLLPG